MTGLPGRASDHGPDTTEEPVTVEMLVDEARTALDKLEAAMKEQFIAKRRRLCLEAVREADDAVDAVWHLILRME